MATKKRRKDQTREDLRLDFFNQMTPITRIQGHVYEVFDAHEVDLSVERTEIPVPGQDTDIVLIEQVLIEVEGRGFVKGEPVGSATEAPGGLGTDEDLRWLTHWDDGSWLPTFYLGEALDRLAQYDSAYDVPSN